MIGGLNSLGLRTHQVGLEQSIDSVVKKVNRAGIVVRVRASDFTQPLGKMSSKANEFTKSLEASNARVIAFGASAAIIGGVTTAFSQLVIQAAKVEKILADINAVLDTSSENLRKFGDGLFNVARNTSQALEVAAEAALEFSRQGLSMEETLKRTNDALILTRLTGLAAADSVKGLTAAVNGFADAGLTTTEIINKLAAVDVKFAVSADDLINALARAGAVAQDAGVDFNSLVGAVTSAQQITARGGAVIGNSFKTIFTRLQRSSTLDRLQELGIAVRDLQGNTLPAINILTELSRSYDTLGSATKAAVAEQVGGVFQINILKAALKDLGKENSLYAQATQTASDATNEAYQKNEMLQKTLSSIATQTLTTVRELTANLGDLTIAPALTSFLESINGALSAISDLFGEKEGESIGSDFAKGLARAVGNVLAGPGMFGLVLIFGKLFGQAFKFAKNSVKDLLQIKSIKDQELAIQESIVDAMMANVELQKNLLRLDGDQLKQEQLVLNILKDQTNMLEKQRSIAASIAPGLRQSGVQSNLIVDSTKSGGGKSRSGKSSGHIPTPIEELKEKAGARKAGYTAGPIATMSIPKLGRVVYNKNETVKKFQGMDQPAIMPPEYSKAGKQYREDFAGKHGFNPYAHSGMVPNFVRYDKSVRPWRAVPDNANKEGYGGVFTGREVEKMRNDGWARTDEKGWHFVGGGRKAVDKIEKKAKDDRRDMILGASAMRRGGKMIVDNKSGQIYYGTDHQQIAQKHNLFENGKLPQRMIPVHMQEEYDPTIKKDVNKIFVRASSASSLNPVSMRKLKSIAEKDYGVLVLDSGRGFTGSQKVLYDPNNFYGNFSGMSEGLIPNYNYYTPGAENFYQRNRNLRSRDRDKKKASRKNLNLEYFYPAAGQGGGTIFKMYKDIVRSAESGEPYTNILAGEVIGPRIPKMIVEGKKMLDKARLAGKKIPKMSIQGTLFPSMLTRKIDKFASDRKDGYIHPTIDYIPGEESEVRKYLKHLGADPDSHDTVKLEKVYKGGYDSGFIPNFALKARLIPGTNILRLPTSKMINETTASDFKGNKIKGWQTLEATVDNVKKHALTYSRELDALKSAGVNVLQRKMYFSNQSQHIPIKDRKNIARQQRKMRSMKGFANRNQHKITGNSQEDALFKSSLKDKGYYPTWTGAYTAKGRQEGKGDENFKVDFFAPGRKPIESKYGKYTAPNLIAKSIRLYSDNYIERFLSQLGESGLSQNMQKSKLADSTKMLTSLGYKDVSPNMVLQAGLFNGYLPERKNNVNQNIRTVKELEGRETLSGYSAMSSSEMFDRFSSNSDKSFPLLEKMSKDGIGNTARIKSKKRDSYYEGFISNFSKNWAQGKSKSSDKDQGRKRNLKSEVIKAIRATLSKRGVKRSAMAENKILFAAEKYMSATKSRDYPGGYININGNKINLNEITLALKKHGDYHPSFDDTVEFDGSKNHKDNLMFEELEQKRLPNFARYGMSSFRSPIMFKNGNEGSFGRSYLATTSKSGKLFLLKDGHKPFSDYMKKMGKPQPKLKEGRVGGREGYWVNQGAEDVKTWAELPNTKLLASQEKRRAEVQAIENERKARLNPGVFDPVLSNGKIFFSDGSSGSVNPDFLSKKMGKEYKHIEVDKRALYNYAKEHKITKKIGGTESTHLGNAFHKILSLPRGEFLKMKHIIRPRAQTDSEKDVERKMNAPSRPIKWDVKDDLKGKKQFNLKADDGTFRKFAQFLLDKGVPKRSVDNIHKAIAQKHARLDQIVDEARGKRSMGRGRGVFFNAAKKQENLEKGFSIPTNGLFIKNLNQMVRDFNKTVYNSDGLIPNFANKVYDRDKIQPGIAGDILSKILSNRKKKNLLLGPSGVGKTTMASKYGAFIQNLEDAQAASSYTILSGAARTKKGGVSPALQNIINAVNQSGGTVSYLNSSDKVLDERRDKRIAQPLKGDLRSLNQLKGTKYAPKHQPDFISNVQKLSARFQNVQASNGFVPNFIFGNKAPQKNTLYPNLNKFGNNKKLITASGTISGSVPYEKKVHTPNSWTHFKPKPNQRLDGPRGTLDGLTKNIKKLDKPSQKARIKKEDFKRLKPSDDWWIFQTKGGRLYEDMLVPFIGKAGHNSHLDYDPYSIKNKDVISDDRTAGSLRAGFRVADAHAGIGHPEHQNIAKLVRSGRLTRGEIERHMTSGRVYDATANDGFVEIVGGRARDNTYKSKFGMKASTLKKQGFLRSGFPEKNPSGAIKRLSISYYQDAFRPTSALGLIPNFAAWNPFTQETQSIAKQGGLATSKFALAKIIQNSPFKDLLRKHNHWNNFPEKHKKRLNQWLRSQGYTNRALQGWGLLSKHSKSIASGVSDVAAHYGHVPNFSNPLTEAISREKHALREQGSSADIYIDQDNRLKNPKNPAGLLVANTRDEPKSGSQGVNRAISMGIDPKTHGASNGVIPNYSFAAMHPAGKNAHIRVVSNKPKKVDQTTDNLMMKMMALTTVTYALEGAMGQASEEASAFQKTIGVTNAAIMGMSQAAMLFAVMPQKFMPTMAGLMGTPGNRTILGKGLDKAKAAKTAVSSKLGSSAGGQLAKSAGKGLGKALGGVMSALGPFGIAIAVLIPVIEALKENFGWFKTDLENLTDSLSTATKQQDMLNQATSSLSNEQQNSKRIVELESKGRNLSTEQMDELHKLRIEEIQSRGKLETSIEAISGNFDLSDKQLKLLNGSYDEQKKLLKQLEQAQVRYIRALELRKVRAENREKLGDTEAGMWDLFTLESFGGDGFWKTYNLGQESAFNTAGSEANVFYDSYMSGRINDSNRESVTQQVNKIVDNNIKKLRDTDVYDVRDFQGDNDFQNQFKALGRTLGYGNDPANGEASLQEFTRNLVDTMASINAQSYFEEPINNITENATHDEREISKVFRDRLQNRISKSKEDDIEKTRRKNEQVKLVEIANESTLMAKHLSFEQDRALSLAKQRLKIEEKIFERDQDRLGLTDEIEDFLGVLNVDEKLNRQFDRKDAAIDQKAEKDIKSLRIDSRAESKKFLEDNIRTDRINNEFFDPFTGAKENMVEKLLREIADNTDPNAKGTSKEEIDFANNFEKLAIAAIQDRGSASSFDKEQELTERIEKANAKNKEIHAMYPSPPDDAPYTEKDEQIKRKREAMFAKHPEARGSNITRLVRERAQVMADNPISHEITNAQADFTSRYKKGVNQVMADFRERNQVVSRSDATRVYEQSSDYRALEEDMQSKIQSLVKMSGSKNHKKPTTKFYYDNENNELTYDNVEGRKLDYQEHTTYGPAALKAHKALEAKRKALKEAKRNQDRLVKQSKSPSHLSELYAKYPKAGPERISTLENQIEELKGILKFAKESEDLPKPSENTKEYKIQSKYDFKDMDEFIAQSKKTLDNPLHNLDYVKDPKNPNSRHYNNSNRSILSGSTNPDAATENLKSIKNREKEEAISSIPPVTPQDKALMNNANSPSRKDIEARAKEKDIADNIKLGEANAQAKGVTDGTIMAKKKLKDKANSLTNQEQTILPDLFQQQQIQDIKYDFSPSVSNPGVFGQTGDMPLINPNDPVYPINQARMGQDLPAAFSGPGSTDEKSAEARARSEQETNMVVGEILLELKNHKKNTGRIASKEKARSIMIDKLMGVEDDIERAKAIEYLNTLNIKTFSDHELDLVKQGLNQKQAKLADGERAVREEQKVNKDDLDLQKLSESFRNRTNAGLEETQRIRKGINNYEERVSKAVQHNLGVQSGFAKLSSEMLDVQTDKLRSMEQDGSLAEISKNLASDELGKEEKQRILSTAMLKAKNNLLDGTERGVQIAGDNFDAQEEERRSTLIAAQNKLKLSDLSERLYNQAETESSIKVAQLAIENKLLAQKRKLYETTEALTKEVEKELENQRGSAYNAGLRNQESNRLNDQIITNPKDPYFGMTGFQANAQQRATDLNTAQTSQVKNARADFQLYTGRGNELRASETRLQLLQFQKQQNIENGRGRMFSDTIAVRIAEVNVELDRFNETLANTTFDSVRQGFRDMMDTMASGTAEMSDVFGAFLGSIVSAISDKLIDRATAQITSGLFDIIGIGDYNRGGVVGYNRGGYAMGGRSSQTPAMLTAGEYVVRKKVVDRLGAQTLDKMNKTGSLDSLYQEPSTDNFDISTSSGAPGMAFMNEGGWLSRQWDTAKSTFSPFTSSSSDSSWGKVAKGSGMLLGSAYGAYEEAQKNAADNAPEAPQAPSTAVLNTTSDLNLDPSSSSMSPSMRQGGNSYAQQYGDYLLKKYDYDVQQQNQAVEARAGLWQGMANQLGVALGGAAVGKFTSALGAAWDTRGGSEATVKRWNERGINNAADLAEKSPNSFGYYKKYINDYRDRMGFDAMSTDDIASGKPVTATDMLLASDPRNPSCSGGVCSTSTNSGLDISPDLGFRESYFSKEQRAFSDDYFGRSSPVGGIENNDSFNNGLLKSLSDFFNGGIVQGYSSGGRVYGPGGIDKVGPVMLDKGEYVVRASSVNSIEKQFPGFFDQLNAMKFNEGGSVGGTQSKSGSSSQQSGNVTVNINVASDGSSSTSSSGGGSEQQMASKIKDAVVGIIAQEKRVGGMLSG